MPCARKHRILDKDSLAESCMPSTLPDQKSWLELLTADQQVPGSNPGVPFVVGPTTQILAPVENTRSLAQIRACLSLWTTPVEHRERLDTKAVQSTQARYHICNLRVVIPEGKTSKMRRRRTQSKHSDSSTRETETVTPA